MNDDHIGEHHWTHELTEREYAQVRHAVIYSTEYNASGIPGHSQFMLIAKLAEMLDKHYQRIPGESRTQPVVWDEVSKIYRDVHTGVEVRM
jgi:hypothetical protein